MTLFQASIIASLFCLSLLGCNSNEKIVASVDGTELSENEAFILMKHLGYTPTDKEQFRDFVERWCEQEAFKAELKSVNPETYDLAQLRAESFAGDLARYYVEESIIKSQLDTIVSSEEIATYYEDHKDEFLLPDYLVKALYLKIPAGNDFKSKGIHQSFLLKNDKDLSEVNSYAKLYAEDYYFDDSTWTFFNDLVKGIPLTNYNVDNIVLNRSKTYFSDDNFTYFLNIIDFKLKDEAPPIEFLADQIKEIIVLKRLQQLKEKNESGMIQRIKEKHEINIHI